MKAKELRIGSYYNYDSDLIKLDGSTLASYLQNDMDFYLEPIPLTEEWLFKFGFISNPYQDRYEKKGYNFLIDVIYIKGTLYLYYKGVELKCVHQLQNLYFSLTNEELKND